MRSPHVQQKGPPKKTVITGMVLLTKCPCLHPGDVRKFTAVDVPELQHFIDCIVFPAQGPRQHPDEMAGSDLDGDEYVVIWEKCLFFPGPNRMPMNFSDRNSESHGKQIAVYKLMKWLERRSAIQVPYAGAKKMLCFNPVLPPKKLLCLRPSMQKFPCYSSEYLEVVKLSAPRSMTLNRPLITILEQLGVPTDTFVYLLESMILEFTDALLNEARAVDVLSACSKLQLPYEDLYKAGFQLTLDSFFWSLLLAVYRNAVAGLRYKTRITLPVDRARNMLSVVYTTSKLRYGEVSSSWNNYATLFVGLLGSATLALKDKPTKSTVTSSSRVLAPGMFVGPMQARGQDANVTPRQGHPTRTRHI